MSTALAPTGNCRPDAPLPWAVSHECLWLFRSAIVIMAARNYLTRYTPLSQLRPMCTLTRERARSLDGISCSARKGSLFPNSPWAVSTWHRRSCPPTGDIAWLFQLPHSASLGHFFCTNMTLLGSEKHKQAVLASIQRLST